MWALRAAVRPGVCLSRVVRGCRALRVASLLPPWPQRALAAFGPGYPGGLQERGSGGRGPRADGRRSRAGEEEDEEPEGAEQEEEDVEELLRREPLLPAGAQRVCLVHPEVKWGPGEPLQTRENIRGLAEITAVFLNVERMSAPTKVFGVTLRCPPSALRPRVCLPSEGQDTVLGD